MAHTCVAVEDFKQITKNLLSLNGMDRRELYFCGPEAPAQLRCECPSVFSCNDFKIHWGNIGQCGCCPGWIIGLIAMLLIAVAVSVLVASYLMFCRGTWWCDGNEDAPPIVLPSRSAPVTVAQGAQVGANIFRGYRPSEFDTGQPPIAASGLTPGRPPLRGAAAARRAAREQQQEQQEEPERESLLAPQGPQEQRPAMFDAHGRKLPMSPPTNAAAAPPAASRSPDSPPDRQQQQPRRGGAGSMMSPAQSQNSTPNNNSGNNNAPEVVNVRSNSSSFSSNSGGGGNAASSRRVVAAGGGAAAAGGGASRNANAIFSDLVSDDDSDEMTDIATA